MTARQAPGAVAGFALGAVLLWLLLRGASISRWLDALAQSSIDPWSIAPPKVAAPPETIDE